MKNRLFNFDRTINSKGKYYLKEIITDEDYRVWFSSKKQGKIFILNKGRCGNGGTTGFIDYAKRKCKGLTIIAPNVSVIKSKEWDNELCCLYGGAEVVDRDKPIRVSTWDQHKVVESFPQFGMDMENRYWVGSLLVVDEYHKLIDDSNFRDICAKVVHTIINTKSNVVLMSATPNYEFIEFLKEISGKEVVTYNIEYNKDDCITKNLVWMEKGCRKMFDIVNGVMKTARKKGEEGKSNQVVFFYNSVKRVSDIVCQLEDTLDVEVLCSKSKEFKGVPCYSEKFNKDKTFHFMTSAYFTGMDIPIHIDKVVIIGGNDEMVLAYSNKEIKQMLGRMREGYDNAYIIHDGGRMNKREYANCTATKERWEYVVNNIQGDGRKDEKFVQVYLNFLYYTGVVEKMAGWQSEKSFRHMMSIYDEFNVVVLKMQERDKFVRKREISFNDYKKKRLNGEKVPYRYQAICEKFVELCGLERFESASRNEIERYVKLNEMADGVDVENLSGAEKYDLLLGDGFYFGRFLMGVLDYLGFKCDYNVLEEKINDVFGVFCIYNSGNTAKKNGCVYLCVMGNDIRKMSEIGGGGLYKRNNGLSPISDKNRMNTVRVSKKVSQPGQRTQCITDYLGTTEIKSLMEGKNSKESEFRKKFFTTIMEDPTTHIPNIKQDEEGWKKVFDEFKKQQTMISEFYKDVPSSVRYPHKKNEMQQIDCLIVDIDDSITYNEFQALYGNYEYTAYPTISNPDPDNWTKFRVIFPLSQTLTIPNDNLGVLKLLRCMVCKFEDKNHQLGAYINKEQWAMRREHAGRLVEIGQDTVVYLEALIKPLKTYSCKSRKSNGGTFSIDGNWSHWSLEKGKQYYQDHDMDGERHKALFVIKNRLTDNDCDLFEDWLKLNHPDKLHHWLSHKKIVKLGA